MRRRELNNAIPGAVAIDVCRYAQACRPDCQMKERRHDERPLQG
jgi:hypothetical protein